MKTTIEVPDKLFRDAKAAAAKRGESLKDLITRAIESEVRGFSAPPADQLSAIWKEMRKVAADNARAWKGDPDAVAAVREQRR